jgi:toxin CptA
MPDHMGGLREKFKYSEAVEVALRPSRQAAAAIVLGSAATLVIVALAPCPGELRAAAMLAVLAGAWRAHRRIAPGQGGGAARALRLTRSGAIEVLAARGARIAGRVRPGSFVAPWLAIVRWRPEGARFDRTIPVFPDMLDADAFRRLRVLLRWSCEFPSP